MAFVEIYVFKILDAYRYTSTKNMKYLVFIWQLLEMREGNKYIYKETALKKERTRRSFRIILMLRGFIINDAQTLKRKMSFTTIHSQNFKGSCKQ